MLPTSIVLLASALGASPPLLPLADGETILASLPSIIWLTPDSGGVADYADEVAVALEDLGIRLHVVRLAPPLQASSRDILRGIRRARATISATRSDGPAVIHAELSAGSVETFWSIPPADRLVSITVHDPPHFAWWPLYSRGVARFRALHHIAHFPLRRAWWTLEDSRLALATTFVLTRTGESNLRNRGFSTVRLTHHVAQRPNCELPFDIRPLTIGLFGYHYGGKGFDLLPALRDQLPSEIGIHVAGRGTEAHPMTPGTTCWGAVDGERERDFFRSIRCLLLPYESGGRYGPFLSASGAAARALSYGVPVIAPPVRGFVEEAKLSAAFELSKSNSVVDLAGAVTSFVRDTKRNRTAAEAARSLRLERTVTSTAEIMASTWERKFFHFQQAHVKHGM